MNQIIVVHPRREAMSQARSCYTPHLPLTRVTTSRRNPSHPITTTINPTQPLLSSEFSEDKATAVPELRSAVSSQQAFTMIYRVRAATERYDERVRSQQGVYESHILGLRAYPGARCARIADYVVIAWGC